METMQCIGCVSNYKSCYLSTLGYFVRFSIVKLSIQIQVSYRLNIGARNFLRFILQFIGATLSSLVGNMLVDSQTHMVTLTIRSVFVLLFAKKIPRGTRRRCVLR
jgi:hypothetical protein